MEILDCVVALPWGVALAACFALPAAIVRLILWTERRGLAQRLGS